MGSSSSRKSSITEHKGAVGPPVGNLRVIHFQSSGLSNNFLARLPDPIRLLVCSHLNHRALGSLASSSVLLAKDDQIWRPSAQRLFGNLANVSTYASSWKWLWEDNNCRNDPLSPARLTQAQVRERAFGPVIPSMEVPGGKAELVSLLFDDMGLLWDFVRPTFSGEAAEQFAKALIILAEDSDRCAPFMKSFISASTTVRLEDASFVERKDLLTFVCKFFIYSRSFQWLQQSFGRIATAWAQPGKRKDNDVYIGAMCSFIEAFGLHLDDIPRDVRNVLVQMYHSATGGVDDKDMVAMDVALFFLRCIEPFLAASPGYVSPGRTNVVAFKLLEQTAKGQLFGPQFRVGDIPMQSMNHAVVAQAPLFRSLLLALVRPQYTTEQANPVRPYFGHVTWAQTVIYQTLATANVGGTLRLSVERRGRLDYVLKLAGGKNR